VKVTTEELAGERLGDDVEVVEEVVEELNVEVDEPIAGSGGVGEGRPIEKRESRRPTEWGRERP